MGKIAFGHPGKMGDALYCLPTIKYICEKENKKADFWTSEYCSPLKNLFEHQDYIDNFYISPNYVLDNWGCGGQPYNVPIPIDSYDIVYQLGFRSTPDTRLDHFIAKQIGISPTRIEPISFNVQNDMPTHIQELKKYNVDNYYVLAPRGMTSFYQTFLNFIDISDLPVIQIGGNGDFISSLSKNKYLDFTSIDFLDTLTLIKKSSGFIGLMSSQLVLANGIKHIPKIAVHDGRSWDMRHVVYSSSNFYPVNPSAQDILNIIKRFNDARI